MYTIIHVIGNKAYANDSTISHLLLQRLSALQIKKDQVFSKGSFPTYRAYALNKKRDKADENAFYTGLIVFTLKNILNDLNSEDKKIATSIIENATPFFEKFKNAKGRNTYNFWTTNPPKIFPNGGWLNFFDKRQALPDDLDDTVILLMALDASDSVAAEIHLLMQKFANGHGKIINNKYENFKSIPAYSTWFGEKVPIDFDISVLSNVLFFVQKYHLKWTSADSASLQLICKVIEEDKHLKAPSSVSPQYNRSPIILYHLSRLMSFKAIPELEKYKFRLIESTKKLLNETNSFIDKTILSTALMRWGVEPPSIIVQNNSSIFELIEDPNFVFFIANMGSILPNTLKEGLEITRLGRFDYFCEAYNTCLLLENIIWQKRVKNPN